MVKIDNVPPLKIFHFDRYWCFLREQDIAGSLDGYGRTAYMLPPNSTIVEPPEAEGMIAVHDPDTYQWFLLPNHRGETWYNHRGEAVVIERPGNPADFGLTPTWQLVTPPVTEA